MTAHAGTAGGAGYSCTGLNERLDVALLHCLQIYLLAAGDNNAADIRMNLAALHDVCSYLKVFETTIGAGADYDLRNGDFAFDILYLLRVARQMRESNDRLQLV